MSNITFDVKCVRADPQAGICESMAGGGGGSSADFESGTYTPTITMFGPSPSMTIIGTAPLVFNYTRIGDIVNVSGEFTHVLAGLPGEYTFTISYPPIAGTFTFAVGHGTWRHDTPIVEQLPVWIGDPSSTTTAIGYVILISNGVNGAISSSFSFERM